MPAQQFRMLLKDGKGSPFPWTEALASRKDMKEVMMTREEMISGIPAPAPVPKPLRPGIQAMLKGNALKRANEKEEAEKVGSEVAEPEMAIESEPAAKEGVKKKESENTLDAKQDTMLSSLGPEKDSPASI